MREYLKSELAPFPLALFDEGGMQKTQKSVFYTNFKTIAFTRKSYSCNRWRILVTQSTLASERSYR